MEETSIRLADGVMACSANIADFTARYHGVPRETIDVVHCGVDAEAFRPGDETTLENVPPTVLFVGNIAHNKGVGTVFDAVLRLRSKYPQIRLQILGSSDGDLKEELQSRVREEGAEKNILFPGFVDRAGLPDYYRHAHAFCSPAQYEGGVANVYLEAMACGCPVVASTAGGAPEAVIDGSTGLLVPPQDVSAVTLALDRLLADEPFRRRLGRTARQKVTDYFAMNKYTERVLATYEKARQRAQQKRMKLETANA
jgi:glycosyltransferase involved in cell wall biosynthesis